MSHGFLAVAWSAINLFSTLDEKGAVLDLYEMADRRGWRAFPAAESYLSQRWNKSRRFVRSILNQLEISGDLEVVNSGGRHRPKTIRIMRTNRGSITDQSRTKTDKVQPAKVQKPVPVADQSRTKSVTELQEKKRKENKKSKELDDLVDVVWQEHLKHHRGNHKPPGYSKKAIAAAWKSIGSSDCARDFELLVRAANLSDHPLFARDIRAEGWEQGTDRSGSLDTIFRHDKLAMRIQAAQEWSGSEIASMEFNKIKMALRGHPLELSQVGHQALKKIGGMTTIGRCTDLTNVRTRYLIEYANHERQT